MWLISCFSMRSRVRSASALDAFARAAAPKITRLDSCPVAPNGARSIMSSAYVLDGAAEALGELLRRLARARVQGPREGDGRAGAAVQAAPLGHDQGRALDVDRDDRRARGQRELGDAGAIAPRPGAAGALGEQQHVAALP